MSAQQPPDHIAYEILSQAHPPEKALEIFTEKVQRRPLNLRPTSPDPNSQDARAARRKQRLLKKEHQLKRRKPKRISAKEKRALGIYDIPKLERKYDLFMPLHHLWVGYIQDVLGLKLNQANYVNAASVGGSLASADFHGSELEVVRSRCVSRVGCRGIVVKDNKFTFELITKSNELKVLPKEHTIFRFKIPQTTLKPAEDIMDVDESTAPKLPDLVFELHGSQFETRAPDRATKKFKQRRMDDL